MRMPKFLKRRKPEPAGAEEPRPQPEEKWGEIEFRTMTNLVVKLPTENVRALVALGVPVWEASDGEKCLRVEWPSLPTTRCGCIQGKEAVFYFDGGPKPVDVAVLKAAQERLNSLPDYAVRLAEALSRVAGRMEKWMEETRRWKDEVKALKEDVRRIKEREEACMR